MEYTNDELKYMLERYYALTGVKLSPSCHMDMEYLSLWYENKYKTGIHDKWAMVIGQSIVHYGDGVVYTPRNITDEIAERLMAENPAYVELFINKEDLKTEIKEK